MSHFAHINDSNTVDQVIVAEQDFIDSGAVGDASKWIQTSYNTRGNVHYGNDGQPDGGIALRKNYAGIGYSYESALDAFIPPSPYPSWVLNSITGLWDSPVAMPEFDPAGEIMYVWDESTVSWISMPRPQMP